jgi:hypothetical protein
LVTRIRKLNALKTEPPPVQPAVAGPPEPTQIVELERQELALDVATPEE